MSLSIGHYLALATPHRLIIADFPYLLSFSTLVWGDLLRIYGKALRFLKLESMLSNYVVSFYGNCGIVNRKYGLGNPKYAVILDPLYTGHVTRSMRSELLVFNMGKCNFDAI